MKAWVISDLHATSSGKLNIAIPDADVCICAGDVSGSILQTMECLDSQIASAMPVVLVLGNHDYYHSTIDKSLEYARRVAKGTAITVLENDTMVFGNIRFIGATLWTDYMVPFGGDESELPLPRRREIAIDICRRYLVDFRAVFGSESYGGSGFISVDEILGRHAASRSFLVNALSKPFDGRTVVLTHHAPSPRSRDIRFAGDPSTAGFVSDLSDIIEKWKPDFWVHGHVHRFFDYRQGETRVI